MFGVGGGVRQTMEMQGGGAQQSYVPSLLSFAFAIVTRLVRAPDGALDGPARVEAEAHPQLEGLAVLLSPSSLAIGSWLCVCVFA